MYDSKIHNEDVFYVLGSKNQNAKALKINLY